MRRRWRWLNHLYATYGGYFWLPCPMCGTWFGGHESSDGALWVSPELGHSVCWKHGGDYLARGVRAWRTGMTPTDIADPRPWLK